MSKKSEVMKLRIPAIAMGFKETNLIKRPPLLHSTAVMMRMITAVERFIFEVPESKFIMI
jgi:hypothetical protein